MELRRALGSLLVAMGGLFVLTPATRLDAAASQGGGPSTRGMPMAASCADDCNRKASDCLDGCEEKFKDDDKARVTCKFACATTRQQCEKDCG